MDASEVRPESGVFPFREPFPLRSYNFEPCLCDVETVECPANSGYRCSLDSPGLNVVDPSWPRWNL